MAPEPINQFQYVMVKGQGNKGASYKYTWKPDWKAPPGLNKARVFFGVCFWLGVAAIPVWGLPYWQGLKSDEVAKRADHYAEVKKRNRAERMKWIESDEMPYK